MSQHFLTKNQGGRVPGKKYLIKEKSGHSQRMNKVRAHRTAKTTVTVPFNRLSTVVYVIND